MYLGNDLVLLLAYAWFILLVACFHCDITKVWNGSTIELNEQSYSRGPSIDFWRVRRRQRSSNARAAHHSLIIICLAGGRDTPSRREKEKRRTMETEYIPVQVCIAGTLCILQV